MTTIPGTVYKRCGCRDPKTKRQLGRRCPKAGRRGHGSWYIDLPIAPTLDSPVGRLRHGGYRTRADAQHTLSRLAAPAKHAHRSPVTFNQWLDVWDTDIQHRLRPSTVHNYQRHIALYLRPLLGHLPMIEFTELNVQGAFDRIIRQRHRAGHPISAATLRRIRDTLSSALTAAVRAKLITDNPAHGLHLPAARRVRPQVWTPDLIQHWRRTGERPALGVWTPEMAARFLDRTRAHRQYALFHLYTLRGLRRSEALGIRWEDINFQRRTVTLHRQLQRLPGQSLQATALKTTSSTRTVALDINTLSILRAHRNQQAAEAAAAGRRWAHTGFVFTNRHGHPLNPNTVSVTFRQLVKEHGLPPIRLHDLRHGAVSLCLEAGVDLKTASEQHGHRSIVTTADTYQSVLPGVAHKAAEDVSCLMRQAARRLDQADKQAKRAAARRKRVNPAATAEEVPSSG